jgi:hypothetical protein
VDRDKLWFTEGKGWKFAMSKLSDFSFVDHSVNT